MTTPLRAALLNPVRLWTRAEILTKPCPAPKAPGVYAWYFRNLLPATETAGCHAFQEFHLLYVGIAPTIPPRNGRPLGSAA